MEDIVKDTINTISKILIDTFFLTMKFAYNNPIYPKIIIAYYILS